MGPKKEDGLTSFMKMLLLARMFSDDHSKWMVAFEWYNDDPVLELRWEMAKLTGDI